MHDIRVQDMVESMFSYHDINQDQVNRANEVRELFKALAHRLVVICPTSTERSAMLVKMQECMMLANTAIAREDTNLVREKLEKMVEEEHARKESISRDIN